MIHYIFSIHYNLFHVILDDSLQSFPLNFSFKIDDTAARANHSPHPLRPLQGLVEGKRHDSARHDKGETVGQTTRQHPHDASAFLQMEAPGVRPSSKGLHACLYQVKRVGQTHGYDRGGAGCECVCVYGRIGGCPGRFEALIGGVVDHGCGDECGEGDKVAWVLAGGCITAVKSRDAV